MAYTGLAKTTFMAGPDDALAAADAYKLNDIKNASIETIDYGLSLPDSPLGIKIKPPSMDGLGLKVPELQQADVLKALTSDVLKDAAADVSIKNCFTNMGDAAKSLLSIPGKLLGKVEATINGVVSSIKNLGDKIAGFDLNGALEKIGNLKAIGCTANALSNGNYDLKIVDKGGLSGLISGITKEANGLGINNVFSTISNVVTDKDVLLASCKDILPTASKSIDLLKDLSSTSISSSIKSMLPSIAGDSINNFRINPGTTSNALPGIYNDIKYTLDRVDSNWDRLVRDGSTVISGVNTISTKAQDFHKTLSSYVMNDYKEIDSSMWELNGVTLPTYDSNESFLMLTKDVGEQDVGFLLKEQFPYLPIKINDTIDNKLLISDIQDYTNTNTVAYQTVSKEYPMFEDYDDSPDTDVIIKINNNLFENTITVTPEKA